MGRRSFGISITQINRMISASNAAKNARARENLIASQIGIKKEQKPVYRISKFDFNKESRVSHIEFIETTLYRKIEKYVTHNGQRHPIYSDWITKTKAIKKNIKLTNENLENLKNNNDFIIRDFCYEIVAKIENEDYYPSWFIIDTLKDNKKEEINKIKNQYDYKNKIEEEKIATKKQQISSIEHHKKSEIVSLEKYEKIHTKCINALKKAKNRKNYVFFTIITLGIYVAFHSKTKISKIEKNIKEYTNLINITKNNIVLDENEILNLSHNISNYQEQIQINNEIKDNEIKEIISKYENEIQMVEPLPIIVNESSENNFIPLKKLVGMNYEKIIGCYVIRNTEKNKYYVGQSKDVLKRVCHQHFNGTMVKNIIFAEDYYCSNLENKDDLFEVKIIKLETKDELDKKEHELILEYDSFNSGYNGTNGNK